MAWNRWWIWNASFLEINELAETQQKCIVHNVMVIYVFIWLMLHARSPISSFSQYVYSVNEKELKSLWFYS